MTPFCAKPLLWAVLVSIALISLAQPMVPAHAAPAPKPAGCHQHGQPAPAPTSYRCCIAGHQQALPQEVSVLRVVVPVCFAEPYEPPQITTEILPLITPMAPASSPPSVAILRI